MPISKVVIPILVVACFLLLVACHEPDASEIAAKYTDQVARAIVEGSWKIAGALLLGLIINGALR